MPVLERTAGKDPKEDRRKGASSHTQASQRVHPVDVHGAATADTLSATPAESQGGVQLVLDADQGVENHGSGLVQVELVSLHARLLGRLVGIPPVNLEGLDARIGTALGVGFDGGIADGSH